MAQQSSQNTTAKPRSEESTKEVFESIIIALILAFVFRAYVVEAFIIPTGSMAPTLLGAHAEIVCQQCGYRFTTDWPTSRPAILGRPHEAICPMCRFNNPLPAGSVPRAGDRILVQKYLYSFQEPERWDVMVFKYPEDPQNFNYIKRLVGLPNEQLYIFEGNLFVRPLDPDTGEPAGPWRIARKAERPEAQRAVWQPVYHSQYVPLDEGRTGAGPRRWNWSVPWRPVRAAEAWDLENQRQYRYAGDGRGTLRYRFRQPGGRQGLGSSGWAAGFMGRMFPYNQFKKNRPSAGTIEEIRLAATVVPEQTGTTAALATTARLEGAPETITASIDASGTLRLTARDGERLLGEYDASPLEAGRGSRLELWYVDHTLMVWFDGDPVIEHRVDLTLDELIARPDARDLPEITLSVGGPATLHRVELDRDLYYTHRSVQSELAQGTLLPRGPRGPRGEPVTLGPDEFFAMGDNSPFSHDSRFWAGVEDWVAYHVWEQDPDIAGIESKPGVVPRELVMGRAFFVYFPALYPWKNHHRGVLPNFGQMRFIH